MSPVELPGGDGSPDLWEWGSDTTVSQLTQLLKNRFRMQDQTERYRRELKTRKRRKNESLQSLYNDTSRLLVYHDKLAVDCHRYCQHS